MDKYIELEKQAQRFLDETDTMQFSTVELLTMFYNQQEQLSIPLVSNRRELLLAFLEYVQETDRDNENIVDNEEFVKGFESQL